MSKPAVWRWRDRFLAEGVDGLLRDATRPPGKKPIAEDRVKAPVDLAMSPPGIIGEGTPGTGLSRRWPGRLAAAHDARTSGDPDAATTGGTGKVVGRTVERHRPHK